MEEEVPIMLCYYAHEKRTVVLSGGAAYSSQLLTLFHVRGLIVCWIEICLQDNFILNDMSHLAYPCQRILAFSAISFHL